MEKLGLIPSPYTILGVTRSASQRTIKAAFRQLALDAHPDTGKGQPKFDMDLIKKAFDVLRDPNQKALFDKGGWSLIKNLAKQKRSKEDLLSLFKEKIVAEASGDLENVRRINDAIEEQKLLPAEKSQLLKQAEAQYKSDCLKERANKRQVADDEIEARKSDIADRNKGKKTRGDGQHHGSGNPRTDLKPGERGNPKPSESNADDSNPGDYNSGNPNPGDSNPGNSNPGDFNYGGSNSGNSNPGNSIPVDSNPGDSNPGNSNPGNSNPGNSNSGDANPGYSNQTQNEEDHLKGADTIIEIDLTTEKTLEVGVQTEEVASDYFSGRRVQDLEEQLAKITAELKAEKRRRELADKNNSKTDKNNHDNNPSKPKRRRIIQSDSDQSVEESLDDVKKRHVCQLCNKTFSRSTTLSRHVRSVHEKEEWKCEGCGYIFHREDAYKRHNCRLVSMK